MTTLSSQGTPHDPKSRVVSPPETQHLPSPPGEPTANLRGASPVGPGDPAQPVARATGREPATYALPGGLGLFELWREDLRHHDGDWTLPGFRALAVYRFGVWARTHPSRVVRKVLTRVWLSMYRYIRNGYGIELPYTAVVGRRLRIEHQGGIVVHGFVRMGDDCTIRQGVTIGNKSKDAPLLSPVLGDEVDVGAGAILLGDIFVGDGARIGANAVVVRDVAPGATVVGVPARQVAPG